MFRRVFPTFDGNGMLAGSQIQLANSPGFSIAFRHDMDAISNTETLDRFLQLDSELGVASTCFFLLGDLVGYKMRARSMATSGYEVQLHSEARPSVVLSLPKIPTEGWLVHRLTRNLKREKRELEQLLGAPVAGHCPHATNNYLYFNTYMNWSIIERATAASEFTYLSDWRLPARTSENEDFPEPLPPHWHFVIGGGNCLVLPTAWDDKFFFSSFEDIYIRRRHSNTASGRTVEAAFASVKRQIDRCRAQEIPLVINLHPIHMLDPELGVFELKKRIAEWAATQGVPVRTLGELCQSMLSSEGDAGAS